MHPQRRNQSRSAKPSKTRSRVSFSKWLVTPARAAQLRQHPSFQFRTRTIAPNVLHVTHAKENGGQWIDLLSTGASLLLPELAPLIMGASALGKHFLSGRESKKEKKEVMHESHDALRTARTQAMTRMLTDVPSAARIPQNVAVQPNIISAMKQNARPASPTTPDPPVRFATMPTRLSVGDVPVLHGQNGHMPMLPITVQRTEQHATMAGSEYLDTLQLLPAQTGVGLKVFGINVNPRMFAGTKLTNEANTWQKYRFRRFVIEYIPIQGSSVTGSFVGYFTNDPTEPDVGGVQAVRNAVEHTNSLMFQPFFHSIFAYTDDPIEEKLLYFCRQTDEGDARLEFQSIFKVVQNVSNVTGTPYGSFIMHYEIDFYYPETVNVIPPVSYPTALFNDSAPVALQPVNFVSANWPAVTRAVGEIFSAILTSGPPATNIPFFAQTNIAVKIGDTVYFRCTSITTGGGGETYFQCYNNLVSAADGGNAYRLTYAQVAMASSVSFGIANVLNISADLVSLLRNDPATPSTTPSTPTPDGYDVDPLSVASTPDNSSYDDPRSPAIVVRPHPALSRTRLAPTAPVGADQLPDIEDLHLHPALQKRYSAPLPRPNV